jgi:hypothetical protein
MVRRAGSLLLMLMSVGASPALAAGWSAPTVVDPMFTNPLVSCPSASFCASVAHNGVASTYYHGRWSTPSKIGATGLAAMSCTSETSCVAVEGDGRRSEALTYNGHGWSAPSGVADRSLVGLSCVGRSFCIAVSGNGSAIKYGSHGWGAAKTIDRDGGGLNAVSCVSRSFCVATDGFGGVLTYNGRSWAKSREIASEADSATTWFGLVSVSCVSKSFCAAVESEVDQTPQENTEDVGNLYVYNGRRWRADGYDGSGGPLAVSCGSRSFCVMTDDSGDRLVYNGHGWGGTTAMGAADVSCPTRSFCAAVGTGIATTYDGRSWATPDVLGSTGPPTSISCAAASFCVGVDAGGDAFTFNGRAWAAPLHVTSTNGGLDSVSCASVTYCVAVDGNGNAWTYNGHSWGPRVQIVNVDGNGGGGSVSCLPSSFCEAAVGNGYASTLQNGRWRETYGLSTGAEGMSVSCGSQTFCVDGAGNSMPVFNGSSWAPSTVAGPGVDDPVGVSCTSASFCALVGTNGELGTFNGGTIQWGTSTIGGSAIACASSSFCAAVSGRKATIYDGSSWHKTTVDPAGGLVAVSCLVASKECVALDAHGSALIYAG